MLAMYITYVVILYSACYMITILFYISAYYIYAYYILHVYGKHYGSCVVSTIIMCICMINTIYIYIYGTIVSTLQLFIYSIINLHNKL